MTTEPKAVPTALRTTHNEVLANLARMAARPEQNPLWVRRVITEARQHVLDLMATITALEQSEAELVARLQERPKPGTKPGR